MKTRDIPNIITILRIFLIYPIVAALLDKRYDWALGLFVLAGLSDGLDGYLAKRYGWVTRLGSLLDPIADKLLLISCYIASGWMGLLPLWLSWAVVLRDVTIVTGAVSYYLLLRPFEGQPLWMSKLNTVFQILLLFVVMLHNSWMPLPESIPMTLIYIVLFTTVTSGAQYVYIWGKSYVVERRKLSH